MTTIDRPLTDREIATRLLTIAVLEKRMAAEKTQLLAALSDQEARIAAEKASLKAAAAQVLIVGERVGGYLDPADRQASALGHVQMTKAREYWSVANGDDLLDWCQVNAPGEVETRTVTTVRPAFRDALLVACKSDGGWVSPAGELVPIDGVECRTGAPILTVKPNDGAEALVVAALAAGQLSLGGAA